MSAGSQARPEPDQRPRSEYEADEDASTAAEGQAPPVTPELSPELQARRDRALAHVRRYGDPVLRTRARQVETFDAALREEAARLGGLMQDALGIGLAATQVGVLHRVLVYRVAPDSPVIALVNPQIEWHGQDLEIMEEGCLSLPVVHLEIERPVQVRLRAQDLDGATLHIEAAGLEARVIQHEVDHLDGVLILDRVSREQRKDAVRALREAEQAPAPAA